MRKVISLVLFFISFFSFPRLAQSQRIGELDLSPSPWWSRKPILKGSPEYTNLDKSNFNNNVQVQRVKDRILLQGKDCKLLIEESKAIKEWTKKLEENFVEQNCTNVAGEYNLDITDLVPNFVKEHQSVCPKNSGPNCWNGALVGSKILDNLRYTTPEEMNFWMTSPLCHEVDTSKEPLKPGDVIAVRNNPSSEVHGFIHISENLVFSKNGFYKGSPYSFQSPENVFNVYQVKPECRVAFHQPPPEKDCPLYANYFRCESFDNFEKKQKSKNENFDSINKILSGLECQISEYTFNSGVDKKIMDFIISGLKTLLAESEAKLLIQGQTSQYYFEWKSVKMRVQAIQVQAGMISDGR
ncbi:MAG: hypothetical protein ACOYL6_13970 [Bacteriovoracaceae bacterium]